MRSRPGILARTGIGKVQMQQSASVTARFMLDPHALAGAADRADRGVEPHYGPHLFVNRMRDAIHSADRLEHRRLHVPDLLEEIGQRDASACRRRRPGQQLAERKSAGKGTGAWA